MKDNSTIQALAQPASSLMLPIQLAQQVANAVRELLAEAAAANTTRSYTSALRYWAGWHAARYGIELTLPVPEATVLQFVVDHVVRRSAEGELVWELPPAVDQALVAARSVIGSRCCRPRIGSNKSRTRANSRRSAPCSVGPLGPRSNVA
jgi:hypothetical protein